MTQWRLYLVGVLLASMFAGAMWIAHLQTQLATAKKKQAAAEASASINQGTAQAVDRLLVKEHQVTREVQNVTREIEALPTGEALVPDDVASAWADGIDGLRNGSSPPSGDDPGKPQDLPKD